jgi:hypothetical protein
MLIVRRFAHRMVVSMSAPRPQAGRAYDVEGTAVDVDADAIETRRDAP